MTAYVHGYGTPEQQRLVEQAEHWRHRLICDGTRLEEGSRLLEVGCGVGAVLAVLGQEYPGVRLSGIDIEPAQLEFAHAHLARAGVEAMLSEGEASFRDVDEGERPVWWQDDELPGRANYAADVIESALGALEKLPGTREDELRAGLADLRALPGKADAGLGWVIHKSTASRFA